MDDYDKLVRPANRQAGVLTVKFAMQISRIAKVVSRYWREREREREREDGGGREGGREGGRGRGRERERKRKRACMQKVCLFCSQNNKIV